MLRNDLIYYQKAKGAEKINGYMNLKFKRLETVYERDLHGIKIYGNGHCTEFYCNDQDEIFE